MRHRPSGQRGIGEGSAGQLVIAKIREATQSSIIDGASRKTAQHLVARFFTQTTPRT